MSGLVTLPGHVSVIVCVGYSFIICRRMVKRAITGCHATVFLLGFVGALILTYTHMLTLLRVRAVECFTDSVNNIGKHGV